MEEFDNGRAFVWIFREVDVLEDLEAGLFDLVHRQAAVFLVRVTQV